MRIVDSVFVIVGDVIPDQTAQMHVIENDHMIQKISATASDPAFRDSILPRTCRTNACGFHAARCQHIGHLCAELAITIQDRVAARTRFRKCFPQLLRYPGAGWVFRDIEIKDPASIVFADEEAIQDSEPEGRHGKEVHGHDDVPVIAKDSLDL